METLQSVDAEGYPKFPEDLIDAISFSALDSSFFRVFQSAG